VLAIHVLSIVGADSKFLGHPVEGLLPFFRGWPGMRVAVPLNEAPNEKSTQVGMQDLEGRCRLHWRKLASGGVGEIASVDPILQSPRAPGSLTDRMDRFPDA
jgi:hypothetical protein